MPRTCIIGSLSCQTVVAPKSGNKITSLFFRTEIVEFYNLRGGKERIFDDMNNGFGWDRLPKSFMAENNVFLLLTALIRNFYQVIIQRLDVKRFGLNTTSRIKAFVFRFISVPAKWIRTSRRYVLNIYTCNNAYADVFYTDFG